MSVSDLYIPRIGPHIPLQQNRQTDPEIQYINLSQIYECRNWETGHINSVLEITDSILRIHKWEQDIYIGFSAALHLQCSVFDKGLPPQHLISMYSIVVKSTEEQSPRYVEQSTQFMSTGIDSWAP